MPEPSVPPGEGSEPTDEDLVRRVRAGDESAARMFERHLPALRAKARARLPAAVRGKVAESDVIQEAYLAAFVALADFEDAGDGSFAAWLRRIVERKVADEVRRHARVKKRDVRREVRFATSAERLEPDRRQATPSAEVVRAEESAAMRAVVESLPADYAAVVRLVHEEGLSLVEAGERMGRTADAVRKLYGRALTLLDERLGSEGGAS